METGVAGHMPSSVCGMHGCAGMILPPCPSPLTTALPFIQHSPHPSESSNTVLNTGSATQRWKHRSRASHPALGPEQDGAPTAQCFDEVYVKCLKLWQSTPTPWERILQPVPLPDWKLWVCILSLIDTHPLVAKEHLTPCVLPTTLSLLNQA